MARSYPDIRAHASRSGDSMSSGTASLRSAIGVPVRARRARTSAWLTDWISDFQNVCWWLDCSESSGRGCAPAVATNVPRCNGCKSPKLQSSHTVSIWEYWRWEVVLTRLRRFYIVLHNVADFWSCPRDGGQTPVIGRLKVLSRIVTGVW